MLKRTANKIRKKEMKETMVFKVLMHDVVNVILRRTSEFSWTTGFPIVWCKFGFV